MSQVFASVPTGRPPISAASGASPAARAHRQPPSALQPRPGSGQAPSSLRGTPRRHLGQHDQAGEPCCPMDKQPHVRNSGIYAASLSSETTVNLPRQTARPHSNPWLGKSHTTVQCCGVLMGSEQTIEQEGGLAHSFLSAGAPSWGAAFPRRKPHSGIPGVT